MVKHHGLKEEKVGIELDGTDGLTTWESEGDGDGSSTERQTAHSIVVEECSRGIMVDRVGSVA